MRYLVNFKITREGWSEIVDEAKDTQEAKEIALDWLITRINNDPKHLISYDNVMEIKPYPTNKEIKNR